MCVSIVYQLFICTICSLRPFEENRAVSGPLLLHLRGYFLLYCDNVLGAGLLSLSLQDPGWEGGGWVIKEIQLTWTDYLQSLP